MTKKEREIDYENVSKHELYIINREIDDENVSKHYDIYQIPTNQCTSDINIRYKKNTTIHQTQNNSCT